MKDLFVPYNIAKKLKELGFDEECLTIYKKDGSLMMSDDWCCGIDNTYITKEWMDCLAPLYQQVFKWFREKHKIEGQITSFTSKGEIEYYYSVEPLGKSSIYRCDKFTGKTYEETEIACLNKLIELVEQLNLVNPK